MFAWGQTPSCNFKGSFTATGVSPANPGFANNTASPTCNAWALTWNTTGFSAISIQLQGSDDGSSWTAFSGTSTVLVGANPSTALSGAIVVQASSTLAHLQVKLNSATGSGTVSFQAYGYNGVTNAAKGASGGGSGTVNPGTAGQIAYYAETGSAVSGATGCTYASNNLTCTGSFISGSGSGTAGGIDLTAGTALSTAANSVTLTVPTSVTPYLFQYPGTAPSATSVLAMSTAGVGSFYNLTTTDGATKVASYSGSAPVDGNCAFWLNGDLRDFGSNCSSGPVFPVNPQTTTYAVTSADFAACKNITVGSGTFTVTLVAGGGTQPGNGKCIWVTNYGSGTVTIARNGQNINGAAADLTLNGATSSAPSYAFIVSDAVNYFAAITNPASGSSLPSGTGAVAVHSSTGVLATPHDIAIPMKCQDGSGSTTTYTCSTSPTFTPAANDVVWFCATLANTASSTLNVNGAGAATIKKQQGSANLAANDLQAGGCAPMEFDGTNWQMLGQTGNASGGDGAVSSVGGLTGAVPGGLILQEQHTGATSAELDFTTCISSSYDNYEIDLIDIVPVTNAVQLLLQVSTNGGSTWDTGTNYSWGAFRYTSAATATGGGASTTSINVNGGSTSVNTASVPVSGRFRLYAPGSTTAFKQLVGDSVANDGATYGGTSFGTYNSTTAVNAFRILFSSGNIASGTVRCYGIAKQ